MTVYEAEKYSPPIQRPFNALFAALYAPVVCYRGDYHYGRKGRDR